MAATTIRTVGLTTLALVGFAGNSLLCRGALGAHAIDAASFTTLRLGAGAVALTLLVRATSRGGGRASVRSSGDALSAFALFAYAIAFSIAYLRIGASVGALVLFGSVQLTMIGFATARGERPARLEWVGLALALGGLLLLTLGRGGSAGADSTGVATMALAGFAWGVYSLRGRRAASPLATTAGNFVIAVPYALGASVVAFVSSGSAAPHLGLRGVWLAVLSGALTSGVCYAVWYAALAGLGATRAAIVQLSVPLLTAFGAVLFLGEHVTTRLLLAGAAIVGGVAIALVARRL
jgi:drug/metabolite transporter (DMT)-like permease